MKWRQVLHSEIAVFKERLSSGSIAGRAAKASAWLAAGSGFEQVARLVRNVVLARILVPEAFGTMALVIAVTSLFDSVSQIGVKEAVIHDPHGDNPCYMNGAWFLAVARGIGLFLLGVLSAPLIARLYGRPELTYMLRLSLVSLVLQGAMSSGAYVGVKRLDMRRWMIVDEVGGGIGVVCCIGLAWWMQNAWALIIGFVLENLARLVLSYIFFPYMPRWEFDRGMLQNLFQYARRMLGVPVLAYVFNQVDVFFVGKLLGPRELGIYILAASVARIPDLVISKLVAPVIVPAYASLQDTVSEIHSSMVALTKILGVVGLPLAVAAILYGKSVLSVLYTSAYAEVGMTFGVLVLSSVVRNLGVPFTSTCLAIGRADILRRTSAARAVLLIAGLYPAIKYGGMLGAAICLLCSSTVWYVLQILSLERVTGGRARTVFMQLRYGVLPCAFVAASIFLARRFAPLGPPTEAAVGVGAVLASYVCYAAWSFWRRRRGIPTKA